MHLRQFLFLVCMVVFSPTVALGQTTATDDGTRACGKVPEISDVLKTDDKAKGQLQGQANFLSSLVGKANIGGEIDAAREKIFQNSDALFATQKDRYLAYVFCMIILPDQHLSATDKADALNRFQNKVLVSKEETPKCSAIVLKHLTHPDIGTKDGQGNIVGTMSNINASVSQECSSDGKPVYKYLMLYDYFNGAGTWQGSQSATINFKDKDGSPIASFPFGVDRSRCIYNRAETRSSGGILPGTAALINKVDISVAPVAGFQDRC